MGQDSEGQVSINNQGWKVVIQSEANMQPLRASDFAIASPRPYCTMVISHNGEPVFSGRTARWDLMQTSGGKTIMDLERALEALNDVEG